MNPFSASNTFDPNKDIPSLAGRIYVVTGGSAGIGFGIVAHLLQHKPRKIFLLSNKEEHADSAIEELKKWGDVEDVVEWRKCDLGDLGATKEVGEGLRKTLESDFGGRLDGFVGNAGVGVGKFALTGDGLDSHFQINHLSQMLLSLLLLPVLLQTPNSRLVVQSSDMHKTAKSDTEFASKDEINTDIGPTRLYGRSKLAQILFIHALDRRLAAGEFGAKKAGANKVFVNASHPGAVETDQQEQAVEAYGTLGKIAVAAVRPFMKDPVEGGCRPALWAATADEVVRDGITGGYVVPDCQVQEPSGQAMDEGLERQLWALSEEFLKERFGDLPY